ncbi:hypothetical protein HYT02_03750 [Candidatus Gottesmanbacteria bacterium]|nr:hypothetical protein [Candidatus Gottesmanbacteria bacterium]
MTKANIYQTKIQQTKPVVYKENKNPRKPGLLKGKIWISDDFNDEDEEINKLFYGE